MLGNILTFEQLFKIKRLSVAPGLRKYDDDGNNDGNIFFSGVVWDGVVCGIWKVYSLNQNVPRFSLRDSNSDSTFVENQP